MLSAMFDSKVPHWYHYLCFFKKQRPKTSDDIDHFESLRWEDQEKIKNLIATAAPAVVPATKGKKRDAKTASSNKMALGDFGIEYSKSSRAVCRGCEQKIMKEEIRISKKDYESDKAKRFGGLDTWHHLTCFAKLRSELGYYECGDVLPGFKSLKKDDQQEVKKQLPAIKQEEVPDKKIKLEDEVDAAANGVDESKMRKQNKMVFSWLEKLKLLKKKELALLLEANEQAVPPGVDRMVERLSDILTFGALEPCKQCKDGQLVFDKLGYMCQGNLTEWTKCDFVTKEPKRRPLVVPPELKEEYSFLKKYKYVKCIRIIKDVKQTITSSVVKKEDPDDDKPRVERALPPLYGMEFVLIGKLTEDKAALKKKITLMGGKVITKIGQNVMAVISTADDVESMGSRITEAQDADIQVVSTEFLDEAANFAGRIPELVTKKSICKWGSDPNTRLPAEPSKSKSNKSKSGMFQKSGPSKITMKLKNGGAVDPDSGLADQAHIYKSGDDKYNVVLGLTDIQSQTNKYYKIQLLEADSGNRYWVFRSWGRIGTTIGGNKVESMSLPEAKKNFCFLYKDKSGNTWEKRHNFVKVPGYMYPIDVDYGNEAEEQLTIDDDIPSKLDKPIQDLMKFIFDIDVMKKVMLEFELDTEKMPLGKLSKKQLQSAYSVLTELQKLVETGASNARFIDASNRFYTFVPHSFGIEDPPIINDLDMIKKKIEMVDNLMEMEIAYSLMKSSSTNGKSSIDGNYDQLQTDIQLLDKNSEEFAILQEYVLNTHAATHSSYQLDIQEVYTIKRQGEEKRYKPFRKLHNRRLLWHGSRRTNYAGILSQGLRIAPPEAPVTGYMFGKGIYFADMVSKSANYCCTSIDNNIGLMLLCEVALGEMEELYNAKYVERLPKGKHSVKGIGRTEPDPAAIKTIHGDVQVPIGKGVTLQRNKPTSLLYNEYIVYDVAQINMKYLLKMDFKYKY